MKIKFRILLFLLAILSLFSGFPINDDWYLFYQDFYSGFDILRRDIANQRIEWLSTIHWLLITGTSCLILLFPFIYQWLPKFKKWLLYIPLLFILLKIIQLSIFSFSIIPVLIIWIIAVINEKKLKSGKKQV